MSRWRRGYVAVGLPLLAAGPWPAPSGTRTSSAWSTASCS